MAEVNNLGTAQAALDQYSAENQVVDKGSIAL